MADTTGATVAQEASIAQPQEGAATLAREAAAQRPQEGRAGSESGTEGLDPVILARERDEAKREAQSLRNKVSALEKMAKDAADAGLSEVERLRKENADQAALIAAGEAQKRETSLRLAAVEAATKLGFRSPDIAYRLLDQSEVEWSDDGTPKHIERLLRAVLERDSYLAKTNLPDLGGGPRGATPSTQPGMNDLLRAAARGG